MTENATLAVGIAFTVVFWAIVIWLFASRKGGTILRLAGLLFLAACLAGGLYLHWDPYLVMICLPAGFIAGLFYAEWYYGVHRLTAPQSGQERPHPQDDHTERFQTEPRPMLGYEPAGQAYRSDRAAGPRG